MGTRSLTHVQDSEGEVFFTLYKQHDGYPSGWGKQLAEYLSGFSVVNGLSGDDGKIANGMECLAAQLIANFKEKPGQFYIYKAGAKDVGEDYAYTVKLGAERMTEGRCPRAVNGLILVCADPEGGKVHFEGPPEGFAAFLAKQQTEV